MSRRVLVVDDDSLIRWSLVERLRADGHEAIEAGTAAEAIDRVARGVDLVLLGDQLEGGDSVEVLRMLRDLDPDVVAVILTDPKSVEAAVGVMKAGPYDYATKPSDLDDVALRVTRALDATRLRRELRTLREGLAGPHRLASVIGESEPMQRAKSLVRKAALSPGSTALISGEWGTGKDLIAGVVHYTSARAERPFLNVTCSALTEAQLESEIFGHEKGAFPDAPRHKRGLLEQADRGTLLLREVEAVSTALQAKLLRFLEEKTFRRVGGISDVRVDVRVLSATHRRLEDAVRDGTFRRDLFYRLSVLRIEMPPLRQRGGDIALLAHHFIAAFSREFKRAAPGVTPAAERLLTSYVWPGNVRELRNVVERAVLMAGDGPLRPLDFGMLINAGLTTAATSGSAGSFTLPEEGVNLEDVEKSLVMQALERVGGNQTRAATLLGVHRDQIRYRIEKFGLNKPRP